MNKVCSTCYYFEPFDEEARAKYRIDGHCYRFPPTPVCRFDDLQNLTSCHPPVEDDDYCGEWKEAQERE